MGVEQSTALNSKDSKKLKGPDGIVTVTAGKVSEQNLSEDEDMKRLSSIPTFYPLLKNQLSVANVKDPPDVCSKIDHRALTSICCQLQTHLSTSADMITQEQNLLGTRLQEIDTAISTLAHGLSERQRRFSNDVLELEKISEISVNLRKVDALFPDLVHSCRELNQALPPHLRMETLDLSQFAESHVFLTRSCSLPIPKSSRKFSSTSTLPPKDLSLDFSHLKIDVDEQRVVDEATVTSVKN